MGQRRQRIRILLADRTVNEVVRVRAIQDDKFDIVFGTGFHHIMHGADVSIKADSDILNVEHDHVQAGQLLGCRLLVLSV